MDTMQKRKDITPRPVGLRPIQRAMRYASTSLIPVLDLRSKERKEIQARAKRLASYTAQKKRLALFFVPASFAVLIGQALFTNTPNDNSR